VFLMRDRTTGTVWAHLDGAASQGPLAGERLRFLALPQMTWGQWRAEHPGTLVMSQDTGYQSWYADSYLTQTGQQSVLYGDDRLPANDLVVGAEAGGAFTGFTVDALTAADGVVNATVGGVPVVVLYDAASKPGIAFRADPQGSPLTFTAEAGPGGALRARDGGGTVWDVSGRAVDGPLKGGALTFVPSFLSAWYGWSAYHPTSGLYTGS
jgi:hypothetical protein